MAFGDTLRRYWEFYLDAWRRWDDLDGRAMRREWLIFTLVNSVICLPLELLTDFSLVSPGSKVSVVLRAVWLLLNIPVFSLSVRRLHDTGRRGYWALVPIADFFLCLVDGDRKENRFGENPRIEYNESIQLNNEIHSPRAIEGGSSK